MISAGGISFPETTLLRSRESCERLAPNGIRFLCWTCSCGFVSIDGVGDADLKVCEAWNALEVDNTFLFIAEDEVSFMKENR